MWSPRNRGERPRRTGCAVAIVVSDIDCVAVHRTATRQSCQRLDASTVRTATPGSRGGSRRAGVPATLWPSLSAAAIPAAFRRRSNALNSGAWPRAQIRGAATTLGWTPKLRQLVRRGVAVR
jgi:hypothetical protein